MNLPAFSMFPNLWALVDLYKRRETETPSLKQGVEEDDQGKPSQIPTLLLANLENPGSAFGVEGVCRSISNDNKKKR